MKPRVDSRQRNRARTRITSRRQNGGRSGVTADGWLLPIVAVLFSAVLGAAGAWAWLEAGGVIAALVGASQLRGSWVGHIIGAIFSLCAQAMNACGAMRAARAGSWRDRWVPLTVVAIAFLFNAIANYHVSIVVRAPIWEAEREARLRLRQLELDRIARAEAALANARSAVEKIPPTLSSRRIEALQAPHLAFLAEARAEISAARVAIAALPALPAERPLNSSEWPAIMGAFLAAMMEVVLWGCLHGSHRQAPADGAGRADELERRGRAAETLSRDRFEDLLRQLKLVAMSLAAVVAQATTAPAVAVPNEPRDTTPPGDARDSGVVAADDTTGDPEGASTGASRPGDRPPAKPQDSVEGPTASASRDARYRELCWEALALRAGGVPAKEIARRQAVHRATVYARLEAARGWRSGAP